MHIRFDGLPPGTWEEMTQADIDADVDEGLRRMDAPYEALAKKVATARHNR